MDSVLEQNLRTDDLQFPFQNWRMENLCVCERRDGWNDRAADSRPNMVELYCVCVERERERERDQHKIIFKYMMEAIPPACIQARDSIKPLFSVRYASLETYPITE